MEGVPREQKMLKRHLPRVIHHQVCLYAKKIESEVDSGLKGGEST